MWKKDEEETSKLNMGSRYKTPNLPVWVSCVNGNWGVLFSPNKDLLKSENRWEDTVSLGNNYYYFVVVVQVPDPLLQQLSHEGER